ncbi:MAG: hypothetical protein EXS07_12570 [Gemmataceae bacterium]|nr:hypothetical protein [Gemmataceae bacterium]
MAVADVSENADDNKGMSNFKKVTLAIILALLLAGVSYGGYSWWSGAPFRNAMAMVEEDVDYFSLSKEDQKVRYEKWRNIDKKLTADQKSQLNDARERQYEKKDLQKLNTFFAMTKAEQKKQLVDEVNREEKRRLEGEAKRKEWEAKRAQGNNNQKVAGAQGGGKGGNADVGKGGGRGGNADGGKGGPPQQVAVTLQQGGRPPSTPESRNKRTSDRLDNSTPEYRAAKMEYYKLREKIRADMGITQNNGGKAGGAPQTGGKRG